jgi:coenzyme F420-reducing hydrogenase gamma subunit
VEGSVATPDDVERLQTIRTNSNYLVTIGACATSGGLQALRNMADAQQWIEGVYAHPEYIRSLDTSTPIREHVKVDLELWGCPVNGRQVLAAVRALLFGVVPVEENDKVCLECKRQQNVCVLVAKGEPCMGPVTRTGCGALCPAFGRDCYACYGPAENANTAAMAQRLQGLGLVDAAIAQRFLFIHSDVEPFNKEGQNWKPVS